MNCPVFNRNILSRLLKVTEEHAEKLYRRTRRKVRNRGLGDESLLGTGRTMASQ
ncbi:hypothetical protein M2283_008889 [Streptomyces pseudovenezuelae]|uniref:Uncharacterized protein n=1 Tax=Streptomyces pseudovenezuelae TaxID=67350 RepID=A0ABT6LZ10_9ACTN|nr:hypothetical protein [Streptomyces pseudovenezuelae]